jgi:prepilin-type N-terminal cleavage/methylation domain-containing protein
MKNKHNNRGMTLIEVLLSIAIFAIVLQVGYSMFFSGNKSFIIGSNRGHAQQDARIVAEHLNKELRYSSILSDSNLTGRYFSIEIVENEDGTNTLSKVDNILFTIKYTTRKYK